MDVCIEMSRVADVDARRRLQATSVVVDHEVDHITVARGWQFGAFRRPQRGFTPEGSGPGPEYGSPGSLDP